MSSLPTNLSLAQPRVRRRALLAAAATVALAVGALALWENRGAFPRGAATITGPTPRVALVEPSDGARGVSPDVRPTLLLRDAHDGLDLSTLAGARLVRVRDQVEVPADATLDSEGRVVLQPRAALDAATDYNVFVTADLRDRAGRGATPFIAGFTTAGDAQSDVRFEQIELPTTRGNHYTCVAIGPDGALWASTDDGRLMRFALLPDGTVDAGRAPETFDALQRAHDGPRLLTGFCFGSEPELTVYAAHGFYAFENAPDFTGVVSRLSGPRLARCDDLVVGLPRSTGDHLTNGPSFGPDGALYVPQASNTACGAPDPTWGMRPERPLNAAVLRLDLAKLTNGPLDVRPDAYDASAAGAPLTVYGSGVRQAYDLLWHSNGRLYAPVNGSSAGGNAPGHDATPALVGVSVAEDDFLFDVRPGRYYGHPVPARGEHVLNGGNPTAAHDFAETVSYPVGVAPEPHWERPAFVFGQHVSANGIAEYTGGGPLRGAVLVCRYNRPGDVMVLWLNADGSVGRAVGDVPGLSGLRNPLDVCVEPRSGGVYVSEFGAQRIVLCRPIMQ